MRSSVRRIPARCCARAVEAEVRDRGGHDPRIHNTVPELRQRIDRADADGRLPILLRLQALRRPLEAQGRRLLRLLLLRDGSVSAGSGSRWLLQVGPAALASAGCLRADRPSDATRRIEDRALRGRVFTEGPGTVETFASTCRWAEESRFSRENIGPGNHAAKRSNCRSLHDDPRRRDVRRQHFIAGRRT